MYRIYYNILNINRDNFQMVLEEGIMFIVDEEAMKYIKSRSASVVIDLELQPCLGGWACSSDNVTGSYVPKIIIGEPLANEIIRFQVIEKDAIKIYYSSSLKIKDGHLGIEIKLRKLLIFKWLELEGAGGIVSK